MKTPATAVAPPATFEYVGRTSVHVVGAVTRRSYWFAQPGARQVVDARDAASLSGVAGVVRLPSAG